MNENQKIDSPSKWPLQILVPSDRFSFRTNCFSGFKFPIFLPLLFSPSLSVSFPSPFHFLIFLSSPSLECRDWSIQLALNWRSKIPSEERLKEIDKNSPYSFPNAIYFILIFSAKIHPGKFWLWNNFSSSWFTPSLFWTEFVTRRRYQSHGRHQSHKRSGSKRDAKEGICHRNHFLPTSFHFNQFNRRHFIGIFFILITFSVPFLLGIPILLRDSFKNEKKNSSVFFSRQVNNRIHYRGNFFKFYSFIKPH